MSDPQSQIVNLVLVLGMVQASRQLDMTDSTNIMYIRLAYVLSNLIILGAILYVYQKIVKTNDLTEMEYTETKPGKEPETVKITHRDYDMVQLRTFVTQCAMGVGILVFICYKWELIQPMFLQTLIPVKNAYGHQLVQIHAFGKKAEGTLVRPFKTKGGLADLLNPEQPAAAIKNDQKKKE